MRPSHNKLWDPKVNLGDDTFDVTVIAEPDGAVVAVSGEVDVCSAERLWAAVEDAITRSPERLVFDLSDTTFIGSTGLSVLASAYKAVGPDPASLVVRGANSNARKVFEISGMAKIVTLEDPTPRLNSGNHPSGARPHQEPPNA